MHSTCAIIIPCGGFLHDLPMATAAATGRQIMTGIYPSGIVPHLPHMSPNAVLKPEQLEHNSIFLSLFFLFLLLFLLSFRVRKEREKEE